MTSPFANIDVMASNLPEGSQSGQLRSVIIAETDFKVDERIGDLLEKIDSVGCAEREACRLAPAWAAALPEGVQRAVLMLARLHLADALVIRRVPLGRIAKARTPVVHGEARRLGGFEAMCLAIAYLYGTPVGYATQQKGRMINDIVPLRQQSHVPNHSGGFTEKFKFHSEDAFMASPPNFIQLGCVRNPTKTPLTVSSILPGDIAPEPYAALRSSRYRIGVNPGQGGTQLEPYLGAILGGDNARPSLRFNDAETTCLEPGDTSLNSFEETLERNATDVNLEPGDVIIVNNRRLVHARRPYAAKCDGTDRWLLRLVAYRSIDTVQELIPDVEFPILHPKVMK
ncbi:TauD/TfdA family dioxygenase [Amycolatopsis sp. RTGN1]|uniref:TauD/TfdA family dioxygenase n=1 Tax=Amycolatopsis ponsaeliensis TaxID=2992142 RepID=UPI002549C54B|nr:TauD/TfdA family dioxygenase [Amycolatopsis sp. RTGN1]